ncbi:olfactory receptor 52E8-like [Brienomyrus brachyistius]|uniref:olfactory receptor 52E8-like n=1 Tax=Brienomyrus brachyistius TaxID=42636 RepID=UPI0020B43320|nr:olfactory receptor 52E8-like [Brienomyrus brachyistius]XP_048837829.1 olfactory receptor 52E8-like [Brienomyrus brachyistius]
MKMQENPDRNTTYTDFILVGFSGPQEWRQLLFIPFLLIFLIAVSANLFLIFIILSQRSLHSPMYLLICAMAFVDLSTPIFFVPNLLVSLLYNLRHISLLGCLAQMFFMHFFGGFQSTVLLWMAVDRYYAICTPLRYNDYMAFSAFLKFIVAPVLRNTVFNLAIVSLSGSLSFCQHEIDHCFCEHMALVTLACGTIRMNNIVGLVAAFCVPTADFLLIVASYVRIFFSVFKSGKSSRKALSTCVTHIIVITVSLILTLFAFLSYRINYNMSSNSRTVISIMYVLFPSCFNPIIYGVRTKEIRQQIMKTLNCGKVAP